MMTTYTRRELAALAVALAVLGALAFGIAACGDDDLFFPGELPPTPTDAPATETPDPDEAEDDV